MPEQRAVLVLVPEAAARDQAVAMGRREAARAEEMVVAQAVVCAAAEGRCHHCHRMRACRRAH